MLQALSTSTNRSRTVWIVATGCLLALAAALVGISDNPPGIALAYLAAAAAVLAVAHPWRSGTSFRRLFFAGGLGFGVTVVLHNLLYALGVMTEEIAALHLLFEALHVAAFLIAILLCPPALVIGLIGWIVLSFRDRRPEKHAPGA